MADRFAVWSASLPVREGTDGEPILCRDVRPWNGQPLTDDEALKALVLCKTEGPQAALEWLSENVK